MTKHFAVLGSPISHSRSPLIHRTAFAFRGVAVEYNSFEVNDLRSFLSGEANFDGLSLTMPLKEQALEIAQDASDLAKRTRSANTLIRVGGAWHASNTDVFGIQQAVQGNLGPRAIVIGSGATARSAIVALNDLGIDVYVWGRDSAKAEKLAYEHSVNQEQDAASFYDYEMVISTIPGDSLGHLLDPEAAPNGFLMDVSYHPWPSAAAKVWSREGKVVSGLEMLIWQAVAQQRLFAGNSIDSPLEREAEMVLAIRTALDMAQ